jgi:uncharacterized membrane protein YdcZ (DUF606 family)
MEIDHDRAMKSTALSKYIGYSVSFVSLCVGTVLLFGLFLQPTLPSQLRIMTGIVFLLLGIYRFVATHYKARDEERANR